MERPLDSKVVLVTGAAKRIGRGIALRLAREGARIAISYLSNKGAAQQTLRQLQARGCS